MEKVSLIFDNFNELKVTDLKEEEQYKVSTITIIRAINYFQVQSQGFNISQQREALKILDKIEECEKEFVEFEDSEYKFLKNVFASVKWPEHIRTFVAVANNIENPIPKKETIKEAQTD